MSRRRRFFRVKFVDPRSWRRASALMFRLIAFGAERRRCIRIHDLSLVSEQKSSAFYGECHELKHPARRSSEMLRTNGVACCRLDELAVGSVSFLGSGRLIAGAVVEERQELHEWHREQHEIRGIGCDCFAQAVLDFGSDPDAQVLPIEAVHTVHASQKGTVVLFADLAIQVDRV